MVKKIKAAIMKLKNMKKPYYILFIVLLIFFVYNTVSLRGFFYAKNEPQTVFGFMDKWNGYTNVFNRSYKGFEGMGSYVPEPENIHDIQNADEWYGSVFGTVVFMKWKWIGLHFGGHMILIDTAVDTHDVANNHFFGHPYYLLSHHDKMDIRASLVFYALFTNAFGMLVLYIVWCLCHKRKLLKKPLTMSAVKEKAAGFPARLAGMKKRYYIAFILLFLFFAFNMLTLRGKYQVLNYQGAEFSFQGKGQCSSNMAGWNYEMVADEKYTAEPYLSAKQKEQYRTVLGTVVFVKQKWMGLHIGNYMILLNTHMPKGFEGKNSILGYMYIVLH